jgi:hypothetical protein
MTLRRLAPFVALCIIELLVGGMAWVMVLSWRHSLLQSRSVRSLQSAAWRPAPSVLVGPSATTP